MMEKSNLENMTQSFFQKPEGKTGIIFMMLLGGGLLFVLYKILPFLIELATNTLHLIFLVAAIVAIVAVLTSREFRILAWASYQVAMRTITSFIVELDPVKITEAYIDRVKYFREKAAEKIALLKGQIHSLTRKIDVNKNEMEQSLKRAKIIRDSEMHEGNVKMLKIAVQARKAARKKDSNVRLYDLLIKMEKMYKVLVKMHEVSGIVVEDLEDQVENMVDEWKATKAASSAMRSTIRAMQGSSDERALFEQACQKMQDDIAKQLGEMETFLEFSSDFIDKVDIDNALFAEEGLLMLDEFEEKGFATMMLTFENAIKEKNSSDPNANAFTSFQRQQHLLPISLNYNPPSKTQGKYKIL